MSNDKSDQAVAGARNAVIGGNEIKRLVMSAKRAHTAQMACGLADDDFDKFRRAALFDCVQKTSFRAVTHHQLGAALKYFGELAGKSMHMDERIVRRERTGESDRAKALYTLKLECMRCADAFGGFLQAEAYAATLLRRTHKLPEGDEWREAHAKQLWQTLFTLRSRAKAKRDKQRRMACAGLDAPGGCLDTSAGDGEHTEGFPTSGKTF